LDAKLRIGGRGSAQLDGEIAVEQRGRCYSLLRTPEMLLLGVEEERFLPEDHAVILVGDLSRIAFPEVVSLVSHARLSGVLRVYGRSATRTVVFGSGEVCGATSERVNERLGEVAVRMGLIKREDMDAVSLDAGDPRRAGRLAVERRLITERDLWKAVQEHVTTVFQAILLETHAAFVLTSEPFDETLTVPGLSAEGLLMEGVRRLDELSVLRAGGDAAPARVLAAYNDAFRDIFATAEDAGAGDALRAAAESVFDDDPDHDTFGGLRFARDGELLAAAVLPRLDGRRTDDLRDPSQLLSEALSRVMLFLLFVAGAHLGGEVHRELHARVKARVSRD
jgi:hypothetical protein